MVGTKDEKNWRFGQKKIIVPTTLGFEIKAFMDDLNVYNDAYSRFRQIQEEFENVADPYLSYIKNRDDDISIIYYNREYKAKSETEANDIINKRENVIRNTLKAKGWTDTEIGSRDMVSDGLISVKRFCEKNIFSALVHRYTFIFYRFDLGKNEIVKNILTEVIVNEFRKQFIEPVFGRSKDLHKDGNYKDQIYSDIFNLIVDPIFVDFGDLFGIRKDEDEDEDEDETQIYYSLFSNRFVYPTVRNVMSSFLRLLQHYRDENTTPHIDMVRTFQRFNIVSSIETIEYQLASKRKSDIKKKPQLMVDKEHDSMLERFFRRDGESYQDSKNLAKLCRQFTTPGGI
ncbi:MAG TPA: hypothetical protein VE130_10780 [Nitrososphaeraceae archaeon]|nr:hypothetical protein [Nitrososphaeraceae archaeon]